VSEEVRQELDQIVREAVEQMREPVRRLEDEGRIIAYHSEYPSLSHFDSGQPQVTHGKGPINYAHLFKAGEADRWTASVDEIPALKALAELAVSNEGLRARFLAPGVELNEWREDFITRSSAFVPLEVLDRLMNTIGPEFTDEDFNAAWIPMRNGLLWEKLPVEIVIPICLTTFAIEDTVELDAQTRLEALSDDEQRARVPARIWFGSANDCVLGATTHAISIRGFDFNGEGRMMADYGRPDFYPLERIERVFEALRIATAAPIGYAQIFMRPLGWAWHYLADLPPVIQGSASRRYPPNFDEYGWLEAAEVVGVEEVQQAAVALEYLHSAGKRQGLASRRFSSAALRDEEDDAILDLCISLEAALGDRQRSEMTYKLSLRSAAVLSLEDEPVVQPDETMRQVKRLYEWRSAIVHGDSVDKPRKKFVGDRDEAEALSIAFSLLRRVLMRLVLKPELGEAERIDSTILLGSAGSG
jgi:hypothetical protein